jgi:uncharacterized alpha-E superfamily protein
MLARVADALFWTGRYLERASFLARAVDVTFHLDLDLHGVLADRVTAEWDDLLAMTLQRPPPGAGERNPGAVSRWILLDLANPASVMSCVNRARNNARMIRGHLSSPMWRELNKVYWHLSDPSFQARVGESPHEFCEDTQVGVMLCNGIFADTVTHDEGWQFLALGTHLERAEKVLRVLESRFGSPAGEGGDLPVAALRWGAVLKKCRAYEPYQRLFISRVEPERVVQFLLFHPDFPHSVRFSLGRVLEALSWIGGTLPDRSDSESTRTVGRLLSELAYPDQERLSDTRLLDFLRESLARCASIGRALQQQYSLA